MQIVNADIFRDFETLQSLFLLMVKFISDLILNLQLKMQSTSANKTGFSFTQP